MTEERRRLVAIVAADVAGYSRLMGADEEGTIASLKAHRQDIIEPALALYHGRIANTAGDSFLIEFPSAVDALRFATDVQRDMAAANDPVPADKRLVLRMGVNVGDVVSQGDDLLGDGVNVAARLEGLAEPGGICLSRSARDQVRDRLDINLEDLGEKEVKNIARPVRVFRVLVPGHVPAAPPRQTGRKTAYGAMAVLGLALMVGGGLWWWQQPGSPDTAADRQGHKSSIAVLPFSNLSDDKSQLYFADGITEDIITDLSKVSGLYVTARSATLRYRNTSDDPRQIGRDLKVAHLLDGSVRRIGDKLRITATLIDAGTGGQIWAERFDRSTNHVFAIQDEIANRVVTHLSKSLGREALNRVARAYTPHVEAYDLYIRGRAKRIPPTPANLTAALAMFDEAIRIDPQFAGGYAGASFLHVLLSNDSTKRAVSPAKHLHTALRLARKAVALDPTFGPGWGSLAEALFRNRDFDGAFAASRKAIENAPSDSLMRANYGRYLGHVGKPTEGIEQVKRAMRMSPDSLPLLYFLGANYRAAGQLDKAIEALREHRKRLGGRILPAPTSQLIAAYSQAGQLDAARAEAQNLLKVAPHYTVEQAARTHVYKQAEDTHRFVTALRAAGLP